MIRKRSSALLVALFLSSSGGCKAPTASTGEAGRGYGADIGPRPLVRVSLNGRYLETNFAPNRTFSMDLVAFDTTRINMKDAAQFVTKSAVLETYPKGTPLLGSWKIHNGTSINFKPAAPLAPGDYLIRFPNAGTDFIVKPRPYNLVRVGSAVRLARVQILADKSGTTKNLTRVALHTSEPVTNSQVTARFEQANGSVWKNANLTSVSTTEWRTSTPINIDREARVTLSGALVDGGFKGTPSGPITVSFVPRDYLVSPGHVEYHVEPSLDIELPSGKRKP